MADFLIIGAQKCGTTSLYKYLLSHPKIHRASVKEVHFFDLNYERGLKWYKSHFTHGRLKRFIRGGITGEATPSYIFHPETPERVRADLPDVRLIAILRDPVERAHSHYQHQARMGFEGLSFEAALDAEARRLSAREYGFNHRHFSYQARGVYVDQLMRWRAHFPAERMRVVFFEEFMRDPAAGMREIFRFLDLKPHGGIKIKPYNAGVYNKMKPDTRERLTAFFRPHNDRLAEYLGRELPWM